MANTVANLPTWLKASPAHLTLVLQTLAQREQSRESARSASRHRSDPSRAHRYSRLGSALFHKSEHVDYYAVSVGYHPQNQWGNRYLDIEPYDRTRVIVSEDCSGHSETGLREALLEEGRYFNASWVRELYGGKWYIATQAPLPSTAHVFLSVLCQPKTLPPPSLPYATSTARTSRVRTVVQLTPNFESGRQKAHLYFPSTIGESWVILPEPGCNASPMKVVLLSSSSIDEANCIVSTVSLTCASRPDDEPVIFRHLLYHAWPDHGVPLPEHRPSLPIFIRLVDRINKDVSLYGHLPDLDPDPPVLIGCSAGIGRTGTFIALSSLLRAHNLMHTDESLPMPRVSLESHLLPLSPSPLGPLPDSLQDDAIAQEIDSLREQRPGMVQREEQILFVYEVFAETFMERSKNV